MPVITPHDRARLVAVIAARMEPIAKTLTPRATAGNEARMAICRACEFAKSVRGEILQCAKCGCICQFKSSIPAAKCPINKW